ncbi:uncharacterized protein LOC128491403 [Spea bombifrons]|uniref:uncharacterized protein LOC128491403 n=1 Tax=Spea bombifrons TaxID=233779 RepID=UPI00234A0841|nr:uncharacterized protein LOC128491403 [Spea bombifrons]
MPAPAAAPAIPPGPPRLRLDDKVLSLEFRLLDAQFNEPGRYQLVLRVENPLLDDSVKGVTLSINHGDIVHSNQAESDTAEQTDLTDTINFEKDTFLFILPQGLCKNDKHHDVRLCIDVLKFGGNFPNKGRKVGQAIFAIYPRTNQPRINLRAGPFQPLYNYQGILALLRVGGNQMAMHCGRLAYNVCFKEYQPPTPEEISKHVSPRPGNARSGTSLETTPRHDPHHLSTPKPASPAPPTFRTPIPQSSTPRSVSYQGESSKIDTLHASYPSRTHQVSDAQDLQTTLEEEDRLSPDTDSLQDQHDLTDRSDESPAPVLPVSSRLPDDVPLLLPSPPKTPSPIKKSHVTDKPPAQSDPVYGSDGESSFLPSPGTEKIIVTLHSATHLPTTTAGSAPSPFVTL